MKTELEICKGARFQYRGSFREMAMGGAWHVFRSDNFSGVAIAQQGEGQPLVRNVQAMCEQTLVNQLSAAIRSGV